MTKDTYKAILKDLQQLVKRTLELTKKIGIVREKIVKERDKTKIKSVLEKIEKIPE